MMGSMCLRRVGVFFLALCVCSCAAAPQAPAAATVIVVPYGSDVTPTPLAPIASTVPATTILGASPAAVAALLTDWAVRPDRTSTSETAVFRYTRGVTLIVAYRADRAIGVYVIDNPGAGVTGISRAQVAELIALIGAEPLVSDVISDENGIREFGVGDITSW